ncbi:perlucin-like protein [Ruditapes philippinarum]|uniref:perlucin-like protein n=1 Tax=Ruditapes philippinarum TaxID=129788 RepID=UPI00295A88D9|nr:perlucin-like protein [Ruditapes philippinarum]
MLLGFGNMKTAVAFLFAVTSLVSGVNARACCSDGWIPYNGHCYYIGYGTPLSFFDARVYCQNRGAYLVRLDTPAENIFLADFLRKTKAGDTWMGLSDLHHETTWKWYDTNQQATFFDWAAGEPNNYGDGGEDCAHFRSYVNYKWNDAPCNHNKIIPLCEIEFN